MCKCLHPVMWVCIGAICVCAMPKWLWNDNNKQNKSHTTTPLVLSKQTPQTRLLLLFVVVVMSHTFVTWSNGDRSRRWEIAVSVVLAEVATLADSSVVEVWQPRTRTPTHVRTRAIPKMGVRKVLFLSQCCKSIWVILSHTHIWRDEYFFSFIFVVISLKLVVPKSPLLFTPPMPSQASADSNNDFLGGDHTRLF